MFSASRQRRDVNRFQMTLKKSRRIPAIAGMMARFFRPAARNNSECRADGFTLTEVLIALAILGAGMAALVAAFSDGLNRVRQSEAEMAAGALAQSLLAQAGVSMPLVAGDTSGQFDTTYSWRLHVAPYGDAKERQNWPLNPLVVAVTIGWTDGGEEKSLTLTTLRLAPAGAAR